jgi:HEAT repeat protein
MPADLSRWIADLSAADSAVRAEAAEQLARLGEDARAAAVPLVRAAGDDEESAREWSVSALEDLGSPADDDLPALAELLAAANADVGYWAATLIGRLEERAAPAVAALTAALADSNPLIVRQRAAWALGKIGPAAAAARPDLEKAAESTDPRLSRLAKQAVEEIDG